jgi:putative spermidine/putrescine transport system substrate-binding protein
MLFAVTLTAILAVTLFTGALEAAGNVPSPDVSAAKSEGRYVTYGQPDDWANWGGVFSIFNGMYGCTRVDTDMSSAEEIAKFKAEQRNPQADSAEIGMVWGPIAVKEGVTMAYKNANWDKIPDWAKDTDGNWFGLYVGVPVFLVNKDIVKNIPTSWADLKKDEYRNSVVMADPRTSGTGVNTVLAAAYALGGDVTNLDPAIAYFAELEKKGNLKKIGDSSANIQKGETPILIQYDFLAKTNRDNFKDEVNLEVVFPAEGSIYAPGALMLNKFAPHPNLAKLFADFVTSDEGQIEFAKGGAMPIRYVEGNLALTDDVKARMLPEGFYGNCGKPTDWNVTPPELVAERWESEVISQ